MTSTHVTLVEGTFYWKDVAINTLDYCIGLGCIRLHWRLTFDYRRMHLSIHKTLYSRHTNAIKFISNQWLNDRLRKMMSTMGVLVMTTKMKETWKWVWKRKAKQTKKSENNV